MYINKYTICLIFVFFPVLGYSTIIYVPGDHLTIQDAINAAGDGDTILIADGIYSGAGNYDLYWDATSKHLVIMSVNGPSNCIIDCQGMGRGFFLTSGQNNEDVINGITITNGWVSTYYPYLDGGGAILIKSGSPQIMNCQFIHNVAGDTTASTVFSYYADGGAIDCLDSSSPIIKGNIIQNNYASHTGGGIHFGGTSSGIVENNIIDNNKNNGCYGGGGIALAYMSNPLIINNLIINNSSKYYSEGGYGGGIITMNSNPMIINNTIANNTTMNGSKPGEGGGIRVRGLPYPIIKNCILWNNIAKDSLENLDFQYPEQTLDISFSNIEGGLHTINAPEASSNFNASPRFIDAENNNYQLRNSSPCINRGDTDTSGLQLPLLDLSDNVRIVGGRIDLGPYENNEVTAVSDIPDSGNYLVYPNPSSGQIILELKEYAKNKSVLLSIYNLHGERIYTEKVDMNKAIIPINITNQPSGIYFLTVSSNSQHLYRKKIIKD